MNDKQQKQASEFLVARGLISDDQYRQIEAYQKLEIFSLHTELRLLIYFAVSLFCGGIGLLIANNIDTIGHSVVLSILCLCILACYYFSYKNAPKFSWNKTDFENAVFEYVVLTAVILSGIFIGYLQFQFSAFGQNYSVATLLPTVVAFATAYYFDNKNVLSIAITGLIATIGLSINPRNILEGDIFASEFLSVSGVVLAIILLGWGIYSDKKSLKSHFSPLYFQFSLHLMGIVGIANMTENYWPLYSILLGIYFYYVIRISMQTRSLFLFIFSIFYSYIVLAIALYQLADTLNVWRFLEQLSIVLPILFAASIYLFVVLIQKFRRNDGSI
ncbi:DUF2157 domain-containing protein [Flavobacterium ardleyense]|uniref:DUF2157 domain-containing protein n=1 Tax=Flavobacterium ardleyense TaxID=2038737 RepID=UPI00298C9878|nr:DUF2157 domain-containing protein [Flavobacterium ardleyense]